MVIEMIKKKKEITLRKRLQNVVINVYLEFFVRSYSSVLFSSSISRGKRRNEVSFDSIRLVESLANHFCPGTSYSLARVGN